MQGRVNFIGTLSFNKEDAKNPWLRTGKTSGGNDYQTLGMAIASAQNNRAYMELFGQKTKVVKNKDSERNDIETNWDDRLDEDFVTKATNKQIIKFDDERHEFVTPWDFIEFIKEHKEELEGKKVQATGNINKNIYNGKISDRFQIRNLYVVDEDTKPGLTVTEEVFYNKDSIDTADWKEEKKILINGYVEAYIDKETGNKMVPRQLVFDCSKLDFDNEKHVKLLQFKLKQMGLKYEDGKIVNGLKAKKTYKLIFVENYVNGNEEIPFDESTLTENQKEAVALGLKTLDDFKPKGAIYGNRVTLYKVKDFDLSGDYSDGVIDADISESEFEEMIYMAPVAEEKAEDILDKEEPKKAAEEEEDDLFD